MGTMKVNEKSNDDSTVDVTVNWVQINKRLSNPQTEIEKSVKEMSALSGEEIFTKITFLLRKFILQSWQQLVIYVIQFKYFYGTK